MPDAPKGPDEFPDVDIGFNKIRRCRHGVMVFLAADNAIGRALDLYGEFAEDENRVMLGLVKVGDTVVDAGANVGTVTLALARRVGPGGRVHAFEPQRLIFQNLCATLALNGLTNVQPVNAAVGERAGVAQVPAIDPSQPANYGAVRVDPSGKGEPVPLTTLDRLDLPSCALLKIDVEGMDYEVLLGAAETIARTRPAVYMEAKKGPNTQSAIVWLQERGYDLYWHFARFFSADNYRGRAENVFGGRGDINMVCVPEERRVALTLPRIEGPSADWQEDYRRWLAQPKGKPAADTC